MDCFETAHLSNEDQQRTKLYHQEKLREQELQAASSVQDWLTSLQLKVRVKRLNKVDLPRAAQLLNKTNQFNLTTRRMLEEEFWRWCNQADCYAWTFRVSDKFGDSGLTAMVTAELKKQEAWIIDFVMSCRVMGKGVENAVLAYVIGTLQKTGARCICATCIPTQKNAPIQQFISEHCNGRQLDIARTDFPTHIQIIE